MSYEDEFDIGGKHQLASGESTQNSGRLFSYPAMQEGDYLTLLMAEKYKREQNIGCYFSLVSKNSIPEMVVIMSAALGNVVLDYRSFCRYTVIVFDDCMVSLFASDDAYDGAPCVFNAYFYASKEKFDRLFKKFRDINWGVDDDEQPYITWATQSQNGIKTNRLKASANKNVKDVFYPSIKEGIRDFYSSYDASFSPILVVLGPPGMGKTSLIRNYIYKYKKHALVTYDQKLMETDEFFLFFLEEQYDLLLLEDFDIFLRSREEDDNKIMNKFLNLSEGIVDISDKKIIVTANLDKRQIDSALVRPGRCFDVLELNRYTKDQATKIISDQGLTYSGNRDNVTLAELFSNKKRIEERGQVGFTKLRSE